MTIFIYYFVKLEKKLFNIIYYKTIKNNIEINKNKILTNNVIFLNLINVLSKFVLIHNIFYNGQKKDIIKQDLIFDKTNMFSKL